MVGAPSKSQCALDRIKLEKHNDFCESRNTKSKRGRLLRMVRALTRTGNFRDLRASWS